MTKKTILLTGASGFVGQHVLHSLLTDRNDNDDDESYHIYALHCSQPALETALSAWKEQVTVCQVDITNATHIDAFFQTTLSATTTIDYCIHTAAMASPKLCKEQPSRAQHVNVPTRFFQALYQHCGNNLTMIALSTDQVYPGTTTTTLYDENSALQPSNMNVYSGTKHEMELELQQLQQKHKHQYPNSRLCLLRMSIVLGPPPPFLQAHSTFLDFCVSRMDIPTTYWTNEIRSVVSASDVVATIEHAVRHTSSLQGLYCLGGPQPVSRYDMAMAALQFLNKDTAVAMPALKEPSNSDCPLNIAMDSSKLYKETGLTFETLPVMVQRTLGGRSLSNAGTKK